MKKVLVLQHQNSMIYSREFFLLEVPREVSVLFYTVCILVLVAVCIVLFGKIDDVVKVNGIVRTKENTSTVKNVISGKIIELDYKPGEKVIKGDILYRIDPSIYEAQRKNLASEKTDMETRLNGIEQLIESYNKNKNFVDKNDSAAYTRFEYYLQQQKTLAVRVEEALQLYREELEQPASLKSKKNIKAREIEYRLAQADFKSFKAEFIAELYAEKKNLELSYEKNAQEIAKLDGQFEYLSVYAPVDGYVQEISSLNAGDYVASEKDVLNIVPNDLKNFRVEMQISPKDIGKIRTNLKVKYRLTAFPFFEYQGAEGRITAIDPDIRMDKSNSLYYCVYADIDRIEFKNRQGDSFPIRAGLQTDARIILETNTILYFILKKMDFLY
ncbi:MAG TPA: hypothetical protein DCL73_12255 [Treponema sp.]|nr:hypothetical protein [Treponema sp.]